MLTVNSLNGGKTSSYIAMHYPANLDIFALVCVDYHNMWKAQKIDTGIRREVNNRLAKTSSHWPEFNGTTEDPIVLRTMLDLEQHIGREITWVRGMGWEEMIKFKQAIPNLHKRFCSFIMKMLPIYWHISLYHDLPVDMRLGYRYDEKERANDATTSIKVATHCDLTGKFRNKHRWNDIEWRTCSFPLIVDKILHYHVKQYWESQDIKFPADSNCQNCFHKSDQQLRKNYDTNPAVMIWSEIQETQWGHSFKERKLEYIKKDMIQLDFFFGGGVGCSGGFCTN